MKQGWEYKKLQLEHMRKLNMFRIRITKTDKDYA